MSHEMEPEYRQTDSHNELGQLRTRVKELEDQVEQARVEMERLKRQYTKDTETGMVPRIIFLNRLNDEIRAAERYGRFLTVVVVSVYPAREGKAAKQTNDLLRDLGSRLHASIRETDIVSAFDDHEIAIILIETEERNALTVVNRLREEADEGMDVRWALASYPTDAPRDDLLLSIAKERLLAAHRSGAGSIVSSSVTFAGQQN